MKNYIIKKNKKIYYSKIGKGNPIVLLHGISSSSKTWSKVANQLKKTNTLFLVDFRGHGNSDHFESYNWNDYTEDTVELIEKNIKEPVDLIGHSLGACVAAQTASLINNKINKIILEDPPFYHYDRYGKKLISDRFIGNLKLSKEYNSKKEIYDKLSSNSKLAKVKNLDLIAENLSNLDYKVLESTISGEALKSFSSNKIISKISNIDTLLLAGDPKKTGNVIIPEEIKYIENIIDKIKVVYFKNTGHNIHEEKYNDFMKEILIFLNETKKL
ncbi:MAG: alpha/beta hydrolase [Dehalococcoidia bacterium]|nr:alpha/beta hydrolase [Dehalococcoidia bacterium]